MSKTRAFLRLLCYNNGMGNSEMTEAQLNALPKATLIFLLVQQAGSLKQLTEQLTAIQAQNEKLVKQVEDLNQQLAIQTQNRFGSSSEKNLQISGQLSIDWDELGIFNEAEILTEDGFPDEPDMEETVVVRKRRPKGKRNVDLSGIPVTTESHYLSEEELNAAFPNGYHQLDDETYKELKRIPAQYEVIEHHIGVYAGNGANDKIIRAELPKRLLSHSILTPSLAAAVFTAKYVNAVPLNRLSECYSYEGVNISRQVMAGWIIKLHEYYLAPVHRMMKETLLSSGLIHCDETPFKMTGEKDAGDPKSKDYMWVYHAPGNDGSPPVYLYEYDNGSRGEYVIDKYLEGYKGILVTDGYQSYHTLAKKRGGEIKVAGCWAHARRKFADIVKAAEQNLTPGQKIAAEAVRRIAAIYHVDNMYKGSSPDEVLGNRQQSVKHLVDAYFVWIKKKLNDPTLDRSSALKTALNYSVNQEPYLRTFLDYPEVPLDNNDAERSIKKFCVGKHSWLLIESKKGASASAMMYSIAETARANNLNPFAYFEYLMDQLKEYPRNDVPDDKLAALMPWSGQLPESCRKQQK